MSELKAYTFSAMERIGLADYYLKSEADKVIAEKDDEITALKIKFKVQTSDVEAARKLNTSYLIDYAEALKRESHHKYKRCLAMAKWCEARYDEEDARINGHGASLDYISLKMKYWERWQWRWEELAEEPTWAKFLRLIRKEEK